MKWSKTCIAWWQWWYFEMNCLGLQKVLFWHYLFIKNQIWRCRIIRSIRIKIHHMQCVECANLYFPRNHTRDVTVLSNPIFFVVISVLFFLQYRVYPDVIRTYLSLNSHRVPVRLHRYLRPTTESVWEGLCWVPKKGKMTNNSFSGSKYVRRGEANHDAEFSCSVQELRSLMELRGEEAVARIQESYSEVNGLCARLRTSPVDGKYVQKLYFLCVPTKLTPSCSVTVSQMWI